MKKRIFIAIQYLEIGGAERALIGLLSSLDYMKYEVDLFVYRHSGEFMKFIPKQVNLLPEIKKYTTLSRPVKEIVKEGYIDIAVGRVLAHLKNKIFNKRYQAKESIAIYLLKTVDIRSPKTVISVHFSYSLPMAMQIY